MRIAYAFPVRHVETLKGGALVAVGVEHRIITVATFPARVRVHLVIALAVPHVSAQPEVGHELSARVLGPDLQELAPRRTVTARFTPGRDTPEGWEVRSTLPLTVGFQAGAPGAYSVELATGSHTTDVQVLVRQAPAQAQQGKGS